MHRDSRLMEPDTSPAFTNLQRHNVKRTSDSKCVREQDYLKRQCKRYHNIGRGARFGRGGGSERGRARFRYQEQKESEYSDQLAREVLDEHIRHLQQQRSVQQSNQPRQSPLYTARCYQTETCQIDIADSSAYSSSSETHEESSPAPGIVDSGANISVTNAKTCSYYDLPLEDWPQPFYVKFGNGTRTRVTQYADFGPIIGKVAVVDDAPDTLISIAVITSRGFKVSFEAGGKGVGIYYNDVLVYTGAIDQESKFFVIDVGELLELRLPHAATDAAAPTDSNVYGNKRPDISTKTRDDVLWLHKRLGHPSRATMHKAIQHNAWLGAPSDLAPSQIDAVLDKLQCTACELAKRNKLNRSLGSGIHQIFPGATISVDYQGLMTTSVRGYTGFFLCKDLCSGYRHAIMTDSKSEDALRICLDHVINFYESHGHVVRKFRFDAGSTESSYSLHDYLNSAPRFITAENANPAKQNQNPVEREVQTLIKGVSALMVDQFALSAKWWCYAVESWVLTANTHPMSQDTSPIELVTGRTVDISSTFQFPFGCPVTATNIDGRAQHYSTASEFGIAVGSVPGHNKGTLVLLPGRGSTVLPRFDVLPLKLPGSNTITEQQRNQLAPTFQSDDTVSIPSPVPLEKDVTVSKEPIGTLGVGLFDMPNHTRSNAKPAADPLEPSTPHTSTQPTMTLRSARNKTPETAQVGFATVSARTISDEVLPQSYPHHFAGATKRVVRTDANPTLGKARHNEIDWPLWQEAIHKELTMLYDLDCYQQIRKRDIPRYAQIIQTKCDLKTKYDSLGSFIKRKARLVVLGNTERKDIYHETYSPTVNQKTINLMLAIAAHHNMILYGLDIFGAFITADIDEGDEVYVQLPKGLADDDEDGNAPLWRLRKTLYGLNRSPLAFYSQLTNFLRANGYTRSQHDNCLFYKHNAEDNSRIFFCIHVDDFAIAATNQSLIKELCDLLKTKYILSESDNLETFLGVHIVQENGNLSFSQPGHIQKMAV